MDWANRGLLRTPISGQVKKRKAMPGVASVSCAFQATKAMLGVVTRCYAHQTTIAFF
ncbi:MAG: hypothetical protein KKD35_08475 [Elusimicrobia bacterium]|nr:hypothetical protein [Elusimicrobiota bacterium]